MENRKTICQKISQKRIRFEFRRALVHQGRLIEGTSFKALREWKLNQTIDLSKFLLFPNNSLSNQVFFYQPDEFLNKPLEQAPKFIPTPEFELLPADKLDSLSHRITARNYPI